MPTVEVVRNSGTGSTQESTSEVFTTEVTFENDVIGEVQPTIVNKIDANFAGETNAITVDCGDTEVSRDSSLNWDLDIEGIITEDLLGEFGTILEQGLEMTVTTDIKPSNGRYIVREGTITQNTDTAFIIENGVRKLAFSFQLQLRNPNAPENQFE